MSKDNTMFVVSGNILDDLNRAKSLMNAVIYHINNVKNNMDIYLERITAEDGTSPFPLAANLEIFRDRLNYQLLNDKVKQLPSEIAYMIKEWPLKSGATWDEGTKSWKW